LNDYSKGDIYQFCLLTHCLLPAAIVSSQGIITVVISENNVYTDNFPDFSILAATFPIFTLMTLIFNSF